MPVPYQRAVLVGVRGVRAQGSGAARTDLTPVDVTIAVIGVGRMMAVTEGSTSGLWQRQLAIVLDGMRAMHHDPLPDHAPDAREFDEQINTWSSKFLRNDVRAT